MDLAYSAGFSTIYAVQQHLIQAKTRIDIKIKDGLLSTQSIAIKIISNNEF
jgi:hypothetical protein